MEFGNIIFKTNDEYFSSIRMQNDDSNSGEDYIIKLYPIKLLNIKLKNEKKYAKFEFLKEYPYNYSYLYELFNYTIKEFVINSKVITGNDLNYDIVKKQFKRNIKLPKKIIDKPTITIELADNCIIVDKSNNEITYDYLKQDYAVEIIIKLEGINFNKNKFNLKYLVNYIKINSHYCDTEKYRFSID